MEQPKMQDRNDIIRKQIDYLDSLTDCDTLGAGGNGDLNSWLDAVDQICFLASILPGDEGEGIVAKQIFKLSKFSEFTYRLSMLQDKHGTHISKLLIRASQIMRCHCEFPFYITEAAPEADTDADNTAPAAEHDINEADLKAHEDDPVPKGMDFLIWNDEETGEIVLVMTKDEPLRLSSKEARALARTLFRRSNETMSIPRDDSNAGSLSLLRNRPQEKKQSQELHHSSRLDDTAMLQLLPNHQAACHESQQRIQGLKVSASPEPYNLQQ